MSEFKLIVIQGAYESSSGLVSSGCRDRDSCRVKDRSGNESTCCLDDLGKLVSLPCPSAENGKLHNLTAMQIDLAEHMMRRHL